MSAGFDEVENLPPFNDDSGCPKCGASRFLIKVIYHPGRTDGFPCHVRRLGVVDEHLCRICERCGYGWCQAVMEDGED